MSPAVGAGGAALIGEECHIVAREKRGPRGDSDLLVSERDKDANLIILCPNHHVLVDQDMSVYTVEVLTLIRAMHEARVRSALTLPHAKQETTRAIVAKRATSGAGLYSVVGGIDAYYIDNDQPKSEVEMELISVTHS